MLYCINDVVLYCIVLYTVAKKRALPVALI